MKNTVEDFRNRTEAFVEHMLDGYIPENLGKKVIHDTIWGSVVFNGWEIQLIDSPLVQRLRDIQQLGRAEMTYPAARHTRFEHSLGVVAIAARMMERLRERSEYRVITDSDIYKVRLAALLHDVGHCFYSHLSEKVYSKMPEFTETYASVCDGFDDGVKPQPHEFFSYLIVKTEALCDFFYKYISYPDKGDYDSCKRLLNDCADIIIGRNIRREENGKVCVDAFMTSVVNGNFDADKLDYTQRDSYTSGIALSYGVDRFLMKLLVCRERKNGETVYSLAVSADVVTTVEELLFNRSMLYVYMYRHQKVLAAEAVVRDAIYALLKTGRLRHPCDFLDMTDRDVEETSHSRAKPFRGSKKSLGDIVNAVKYRSLPKRVVELKADDVAFVDMAEKKRVVQDKFFEVIEKTETAEEKRRLLSSFTDAYCEKFSATAVSRRKIEQLVSVFGFRDYESYMSLRTELYTKICTEYEKADREVDFDLLDIHIDFPNTVKDKSQFPVVDKNKKTPEMHSFRYIKDWSQSFNASNWRGCFFASTVVDRQLAKRAVYAFITEKCPEIQLLKGIEK